MDALKTILAGKHYAAVAVAFALLLLCAGCAIPQVAEPLTAKYSGSDGHSQLEFWNQLGSRPVICNDEAFHGILLFVDSKDEARDYAQRLRILKERHLLSESFHCPANQAMERGTAAGICVQVLGMRGGWAMHVLGPVPRYALRELVRRGVFPPSSVEQTFSGAEFVSVIGRLEDAQERRSSPDRSSDAPTGSDASAMSGSVR